MYDYNMFKGLPTFVQTAPDHESDHYKDYITVPPSTTTPIKEYDYNMFKGKDTFAQINPVHPTGLEPAPKDWQYDVPL
jgi:hypothetical protein